MSPPALRVLIVDDEAAIALTLAFALEANGFSARHVTFAHEALAAVSRGEVDFLVLDVGLPDQNGFELCKEIRKISSVPVLYLTARGDEIDRIVGLEIGGDDYVTKPFSPREVVARIRAIAKRAAMVPAPPPAASKEAARWFSVNDDKARISFCGAWVDLTRAEFMILRGLLRTPERVYSRGEMLAFVSDEPGSSLERTVDVHVKAIRAKLRAVQSDIDPIETHRGFGYSAKNDRLPDRGS